MFEKSKENGTETKTPPLSVRRSSVAAYQESGERRLIQPDAAFRGDREAKKAVTSGSCVECEHTVVMWQKERSWNASRLKPNRRPAAMTKVKVCKRVWSRKNRVQGHEEKKKKKKAGECEVPGKKERGGKDAG